MTGRAALMRELDSLPQEYFSEVANFIAWLKERKLRQVPETMLLSEQALAEEWDTPEEDEAWVNL